jgi:hypothetical protein
MHECKGSSTSSGWGKVHGVGGTSVSEQWNSSLPDGATLPFFGRIPLGGDSFRISAGICIDLRLLGEKTLPDLSLTELVLLSPQNIIHS